MRAMKLDLRIFLMTLCFTMTSGLVMPAQASAGLWSDIVQTYVDLFDPPLMPWHDPVPVKLLTEPEDYEGLGMVQGAPEPWEDGMRIDPNGYSFEWWYFDAHFSDGSSVVVAYYTKPQFTPDAPLSPIVTIDIVTASGENISKRVEIDPSLSSFSTTGLDVQVGVNTAVDVNQDLSTFAIYGNIEGVEIDLTLERNVPAWRPGSGHIAYGEQLDRYFAWLPSAPNGIMTGTMTYNDTTHNVTGSGYHDHNWGNADMAALLKRWWWTRSQVGPYTVIAVNQRLKNKYGNNNWVPVFTVLDENEVLIDEVEAGTDMTLTLEDWGIHEDSSYNGLIPDRQIFRAEKSNGDYAEIKYDATEMLRSTDLLEVSGLSSMEKFLARAVGKKPWYTRFSSSAELTLDINGVQYDGVGIGTVEFMELE